MNSQTSCHVRMRTAIIGGLWMQISVAAILLLAGIPAMAQQEPATSPQTQASSPSAFRVNGELGTFGELYGISGHERRRPSSTGRLFLRSTLTAWNSISASFNVMLSSEGSSARQDINQFDFNPRWRWGEAHMGDFTEELTPLTLSGIRVRGGALMLSPAKWRFGLLSGMTTRSVATESSSRSYERSITGVRLGYGSTGGSSFDLFVLNARDRLNSIADVPVDTSSTDTVQTDFEQNPVTVTPQENLVVSAATSLALFQRKLKWRTEVGASAITRDRRSAELDNSGVPDFLTNLFTPRKSSGADFAYTTDLNLDLRKVALTAGFHYIGPGYVSLGVASLLSDKQEITAGISYRFRSGMVRFDGALQNDNLIHQKSYTTDRTRFNSYFSYRIRPNWNVTLGATYIGMNNDAASDTTRLEYSNWVLRNGHQLNFRRQLGLKNLAFDIVYQHASDKNPLRQAAGMDSRTITAGAGIGINSALDVAPSIGLISSRSGAGKRVLTQNYAVSAHHGALQRKLVSSATIGIAVGEVTTTLRPSLKSSYEFRNKIAVAVEIETTSVRGGEKSARFNETAGRLTITRRF